MLGFYSPLLIFQAICLYHAYKNNAEQRWYWLILFLPAIGCLLYLYEAFYSRSTVNNLAQGVKTAINRNYRVEQLERTARFANNVTNKINLEDAYVDCGRYDEAISLYNECLRGFMAGDLSLRMKLLQASFLKKDYAVAIVYGNDLEKETTKVYKHSEARVAYAWSLFYEGNSQEAASIFQQMDLPYTNYWHRLEYCKFLKEVNQHEELSDKVTTLLEEFEYVKGPERKLYRKIMSEVRELQREQMMKVKS
jgi:hypothetical protein